MASLVRALLSGVLSGDAFSKASSKAVRLAAVAAISGVAVSGAQLAANAQAPDTQPPASAPSATRAVEQSDSPIGIAAGQALMRQAEGAIASQNYAQAATDLVAARKALNDVSTYYQNIAGVFVGVDSRVNRGLRDLAVEAAQVRDEASYQLAVVYRAQGSPDLAVPLLVEVLQSQQPTRPLGQQAYQQLYELGFVEVPYDAPSSRSRGRSSEPEETQPDMAPAESAPAESSVEDPAMDAPVEDAPVEAAPEESSVEDAPAEESAGEATEAPVEQPDEAASEAEDQ